MPTEENSIFNTLYAVDGQGKQYEIGKLQSIDIKGSNNDTCLNEFLIIPPDFEIKMNRWNCNLFMCVCGFKRYVPNNWLKRNHLPMNRRKK